MSVDLFPRVDSLLPWLPGETLFSLCSRQHRLWGYELWGALDRVAQGLRPLQVLLLTFECPSVARSGDCFLVVSVSSPVRVDRQHPLHCRLRLRG